MAFHIIRDEEIERKVREAKNDPAFSELFSKTMELIETTAVEIIHDLEKEKSASCPCVNAEILKKLKPEHIQGVIIFLSRLTAVEHITSGSREKYLVGLLHHALVRRDEILDDQLLSESEIITSESI